MGEGIAGGELVEVEKGILWGSDKKDFVSKERSGVPTTRSTREGREEARKDGSTQRVSRDCRACTYSRSRTLAISHARNLARSQSRTLAIDSMTKSIVATQTTLTCVQLGAAGAAHGSPLGVSRPL